MKLHLGCGGTYLPGYTNIDYPVSDKTIMKVKADIYQDITTLNYSENSIDEVRNHHVFEHFNRVDALKELAKWRKWLKPGGKLVIETPDFFWCSFLAPFATFKYRMELGRHLFGSQEAPWANHLDFWDGGKFKKVLKIFGFTNIKVSHPIYRNLLPNVRIECIKKKVSIDYDLAMREILEWYIIKGEDKEKFLSNWLE